jgi:DNA invertase Pin-like site-specific DNA recombinase
MLPILTGFARVSTIEQSLDFQTDALISPVARSSSQTRPVVRVPSGRGSIGPSDTSRKGDALVVWKLDRLGRRIRHLTETAGQLQ